MDLNTTYTLRQDLIPFTPKGEVNFLPNVRFYQYDNFDQAFLKMYQTVVDYYDKHTAKSRGLPFSLKGASIYSTDPLNPIVSIKRSEPFDKELQAGLHLPNETLYIDKGNAHELMSPALRSIIDKSEVGRMEFPHLVIGVYSRDLLRISAVREVENDYLYGMLKDSMANRFHNPFAFEVSYKSFGNSLSLNVEDGALMKWTFALPTLRAAMVNLLTLDFDRLESVEADISKNPKMIADASIADRAGGSTIGYIRHVTNYLTSESRSDAGMYLQFNNLPMRYLVETQIPEIAELAPGLQQNSLLLATPDQTGKHFTNTQTAEQLIYKISDRMEERLKIISRERSFIGSGRTWKNGL